MQPYLVVNFDLQIRCDIKRNKQIRDEYVRKRYARNPSAERMSKQELK